MRTSQTARGMSLTYCGCWFPVPTQWGGAQRQYLPQVQLESHTTILSTTSRTTLKQVFINSQDKKLDEVQYTFPLYDGVSVVGFKCTVANKVLIGVVKEKRQARKDYQEAIDRGETAGLLEQIPEASDAFNTKIGNVPAGEKVHVEITYLGELKHDAESDGSRFTIPTVIAPRYGSISHDTAQTTSKTQAHDAGGIKILVDVALDEGSIVRGLQSPSHPIAVSMGRMSSMDEDVFENTHASATLTLGKTELDKDFIIVVQSKEQGTPRALLETHPVIPNQRALMATLVPKFNIPNIAPEIVFVVDRSGSMEGKIDTLVAALKIFLKSLPANGTKFNICSFGSHFDFLFKKSKTYDQSSLNEALQHLQGFSANYGGTEMLEPVKGTCKNRFSDMPLEVMVLTDGQIWNQDDMFTFINQQKNARFFSLGIGDGASSALVEGIARAGNGFAQFVGENEKMDRRVVRMLKGALTPHIEDYRLEVQYRDDADNDFELVESPSESMKTVVSDSDSIPRTRSAAKKVISLFDSSAKEEDPNASTADRFSGLPKIAVPKILQAPHQIPALYPFNRTTVYLLLGPDSTQKTPKSVILRGTSEHGPLELQIPVQDIGRGETIHQLAAKKAVHELEQGRGWITDLKINNKSLKSVYEGRWDLIVEREAVRLGVEFQVGGKHCSFVAVEKRDGDAMVDEKDDEYEIVVDRSKPKPEGAAFGQARGGGSLFGAVAYSAAPSGAFGMQQAQARMAPPVRTMLPPAPAMSSSFGQMPTSHACMRPGGVFGSRGSGFGGHPASTPQMPYNPPATTLDSLGPLQSAQVQSQRSHASMQPSYALPPPPPQQQPAVAHMQLSGGYQANFEPQQASMRSRNLVSRATGGLFGASASPPAAEMKKRSAPRKQLASKAARKSAPSNGPVKKKESFAEAYDPTIEDSMRIDYSDEMEDAVAMSLDADEEGSTGVRQKVMNDDEKMHKLIEMQEFDGSWADTAALWELIGVEKRQAEGIGAGKSEKVMATTMAVAWLQVKMKAEEDLWEMVVEKAKTWLQGVLKGSSAEKAVSDAQGVVAI